MILSNPYSTNKVLGTSKDSLISDIYLMDCIEGMKQYPDKYFDLCISDPPFGINIEQRVFKDGKKWDTKTPSKEYFNEICNYFNFYCICCSLLFRKVILINSCRASIKLKRQPLKLSFFYA